MQSKWFTWQPGSGGFVGSPRKENPIVHSEWGIEHESSTPSIIESTPSDLPTKPSKPSSVGFVGAPCPEISIKGDQVPQPVLLGTPYGLVPSMPPGIRLIEWKLKDPPVAIETCAVVTNTSLFAKSTLEQLRIALAEPKRWVGWSVPQLVDRLAQVGVQVELESNSKPLERNQE